MKKKTLTLFSLIVAAGLLFGPAMAYAIDPIDLDIFGLGEQVGTIHVELKPNGANFGLIGAFNVTKEQDGIPLTVDELEDFLGQDHLNWFQKVIVDTHPPNDADGNPLVPPYIDPPINGYDFQWADDRPWYFDEFSKPAAEPRNWDAAFLLDNNLNGSTLKYFDFPSDSVAGTVLEFATFLISDYGNESYSVLGGFLWSTLTEINEGQAFTTISSLSGGANFTKEFEGEVLREFGFTLIPEPSTVLLISFGFLGLYSRRRQLQK